MSLDFKQTPGEEIISLILVSLLTYSFQSIHY